MRVSHNATYWGVFSRRYLNIKCTNLHTTKVQGKYEETTYRSVELVFNMQVQNQG